MNTKNFNPMLILHPYILFYIGAIVGLNLGFSYVPMIETVIGMASPMAIVAGAVFVIRDFAQRETGHTVLFAMAVGAALSYIMADPFVAFASVAAFAIAEISDWILYTVTKKPFHKRVLISSLISTPVDTAVFLLLISHMTWGTFVLMVGAKMVAALFIWLFYRTPEAAQAA